MIPHHIRASDIDGQDNSHIYEDKGDSSMFERDSVSNLREDHYMYEGGSEEEEGNKPHFNNISQV